MGVIRHVDAGYDKAIQVAAERNVHIPMQPHSHEAKSANGDLL
jgi:urocanate hydratase